MPAVVLMQVVKGMQMEGLRVVGDPADMVRACSPRTTGTFAGVAAGAEVINNHPKHAVCARQAKRYYDEGCDEILYIDVVASLYDRPNLSAIIECVWRMPGCEPGIAPRVYVGMARKASLIMPRAHPGGRSTWRRGRSAPPKRERGSQKNDLEGRVRAALCRWRASDSRGHP